VLYLRVRSFALAIFLIGKGHNPTDAVLIDGKPVFRFPIEADPATDSYASAKSRLDTLAKAAREVSA
jgi:hypothetical protein